MKDINIKNIIAKMYSVILSFFFILILSLFLLFGLLLHGIKIDNLYLTHLKIQQLYIKWDKGLIVTAEKLSIQKNQHITSVSNKSYMHDIFVGVHYLQQLSDILKKVSIKDFRFNNTHSIIHYNINKPSFVDVTSSQWLLKSVIKTKHRNIDIHIVKLINQKRGISISGNITLKRSDKSLNAKLIAKLDSNISLLLSLNIKKNILTYRLFSKHNITNIQKILHDFTIPKSIAPWIFENALHVKSITLHNFQGHVNLNNPTNAFKQLSLNMDFNQMSYKFDKNLASIVSPKTVLTIQNGIIKIYPQNAIFLNQSLQKSWLYINPLGVDPLIGIYILGNLQLSKQLNSLLKYYNIQIPFIQSKSKTHTYLQLMLHLHNFHINAQGVFSTKNSLFNYRGHTVYVPVANLSLNNNLMNINQLTITDDNNTKANMVGKINFKQQTADITCKIDRLRYNIGKHYIALKTNPLILTYTKNPFYSKVNIPSSVWIYHKQLIMLKKVSLPINVNTGQISIPHTIININNNIKFFLKGHINIQKKIGKINLNLIKFKFHSIKLNQINLPLRFNYNRFVTLASTNLSRWAVGDKNITLGHASIQLKENKIFIRPVKLTADKNISAKISAIYNFTDKTGNLYIQKLVLHNPIFNQILHDKHSISLKLMDKNHIMHLYSKQFGADISLYPHYWKANLNLSKLAHFVSPLQQYSLTRGYLSISSKNNTLFLLHGSVYFPYPIIIEHTKKIHNYNITGSYNKLSQALHLKINSRINILINKQIHISSPSTNVNILALISFFKSHQFKSKAESKAMYITLNNGYLYAGKNRRILFDNLQILYINSIATAILTYKNAKANLKLNSRGHFDLFGAKFNDNFINHIFTTSELSGGTLSFALRGDLSNYDGLIEIKGATLKNYTILNNILAFINTVPALTSFSLPNYSTKGLPTQKMYCAFNNKNNILTLKEIALSSKKLNIYGKGKVDLKTRKLNIALNLKTNIASTLSKIPLVGYILFNKNSISTSLKITGTIDKPKIQTSVAKDIILAPFNIIKRTFLSPFELVMPKKNFNNLF